MRSGPEERKEAWMGNGRKARFSEGKKKGRYKK
jgi:hypothetical protein